MDSLFDQVSAFAAVELTDDLADTDAGTAGFWSEDDIIHRITRSELLEDGQLVDLVALAPDVCQQHVDRVPIACTAAVWSVLNAALQNKKWCNDINGLIHDLLWMARGTIAGLSAMRDVPTHGYFKVIIKGAGRKSLYMFKITLNAGDHGEATLTISDPDED